jgi:uncharacterized protein
MIAVETLGAKEARLRELVRALESCVVAFSGGIDSALVLTIATQELGERAHGVTARSESLAEREYAGALAFAEAIEARHDVLETHELDDPQYAANPADRCYYCKKELYGRLAGTAREKNVRWVVDGFNLDDAADWRPGRRAAAEFGVRSPLAEAGLSKSDVRELSKKLGLEIWDKPALACLSSRFPYGTPITLELLRRVDRAEQAVHDAGIRVCRVRHHGDVARIEIPLEELGCALRPDVRAAVVAGVKAAGYRFVALDLSGYVSGNLNTHRHG